MTIFSDPAWNSLLAQSDWDDAYDELQARLDRADDHAPSICPAIPTAAQGSRPVTQARGLPSLTSYPVSDLSSADALGSPERAARGRREDHEEAAAGAVNAAAA